MYKIDEIQVVCIAEFHAIEGKTEELITALHSLIKPTHEEEGCVRYELNQRTDNPRWVTFVEKWKNKASFDTHCNTAYITHYFSDVRPGCAT
jgi:quinol monooxygenase YgiN